MDDAGAPDPPRRWLRIAAAVVGTATLVAAVGAWLVMSSLGGHTQDDVRIQL
jgi:hypothetical protein